MKSWNSTGQSEPTADRGRERRAAKYRRAKEHALAHFRNQRLEESLLFAQAASTYAWMNHFGVWYDDELERLLSAVGVSMFHDLPDRPPAGDRDHRIFLYIATALDGIGGHGEVLRLWLKLFSGTQNVTQYVLTTLRVAPAFLAKAGGAGGPYLSIDGDTLMDRIESLVHQGLEVAPDCIFLFANPDDVVAISAVSVLKAKLGARVVFCDHAGFVFWLGKNVTDVLVALAPSLAYVSRKFRGYEGCLTVIPLTTDLADGSRSDRERDEAQHSTVSLSIGAPWKMVSDGFWDYFGAIRGILERNPTHTHVLLTLPDPYVADALRDWPESLLRRMIVHYSVRQLSPYYRRADFVIETFPFSGGQVRVEAMAFGLPVIFMQNSRFPLALAHAGIDAIAGSYPFIARSNGDMIDHADVLIGHLDLRRKYGEFLRAMFLRDHSPDVVRSKLERLPAGGGPPDWRESFSEMAGTVTVDDNYLLSADLGRDWAPSPFVPVLRQVLQHGRFSFRVLFECVRNLKPEDWLWSLRSVWRAVYARYVNECGGDSFVSTCEGTRHCSNEGGDKS